VRSLHPFTLLTLAAVLPALAWILPAPGGGLAALTVAALLLLIPGASPGLSVAWTAALTAAPFWFFLYLLHGFSGLVTTGLRLTTMIASFVWLIAMLPPARLVEGMVAAGWPVSAAFLFSATLSAVPALRDRARRLVEAQRCRGLRTRGGPLVRLRALRALVLPLVLSSLHEVDERALALETRGLTAGARRTPLAPPADHAAERLLRWGLAASCVVLLVWRVV
jgi:energy-coupling factor transport system permease protein